MPQKQPQPPQMYPEEKDSLSELFDVPRKCWNYLMKRVYCRTEVMGPAASSASHPTAGGPGQQPKAHPISESKTVRPPLPIPPSATDKPDFREIHGTTLSYKSDIFVQPSGIKAGAGSAGAEMLADAVEKQKQEKQDELTED